MSTWTRETCPKDGPRNLRNLSAPERERFARIGGATAQALGVAHQWAPDEAKRAGHKGGVASGVARRARAAAGVLAVLMLATPVSALPVWPEPAGCNCDWIETIQPPDDTPDPVQTAEERMADLLHEPPPEFTLVCVIPPSQPPSGPTLSTPEPATWLLLVAAVVLIPLKVRR